LRIRLPKNKKNWILKMFRREKMKFLFGKNAKNEEKKEKIVVF
jgi:hypothetical protein